MQEAIIRDVSEIIQTRHVGVASFSILLFDHLITLADEVDYIWKRSKGPLVYLFLFNRYLMPLGFIINIVAYNLQSWSIESCAHYVRYEGSMTVIGIEVVGLMMLLRVYALYQDKFRPMVAFVVLILLVETGVNIWLLMNGIAVPHKSGVHSCSMIFSVRPAWATASAWLPLLYDTVVLMLILHRIIPSIRHKEAGQVMRTIFHDGLLYYSVICSVTLVLTVMLAAASPGIRNITAQLELLITVTMMSRITLNLKKHGLPESTDHRGDGPGAELTFSRDRSFSDATTRTRSRSFTHSDYLTGGADLGVNFVRPALRRLSTICSERSSGIGKGTPGDGGSPISVSAGISELMWNNTQLNGLEVEVTQVWTPVKKDEETL